MTIHKNTQWIRKQKAVTGTFGLEIETESLVPYPIEGTAKLAEYNFPAPHTLKDWKIIEDHSLRNFGYEYVLTKPMSFEDVKGALKEFKDRSEELEIEFLQDRHSTSIHVHINMQHESFKTLGNFCTLFILFEEVLVQFCGQERKSNFFCITSKYAEGVTKRFTSFFDKVWNGQKTCLTNLDPEVSKYSSLNIVPLYKLGSVEVRTMRGVTDVATIYKWVGMLNSLLEFARRNITPLDVIDLWRREGMDFFYDIFGKDAKLLEDQNTLGLIEENLWPASSIACSVPDWKQIDKRMQGFADEYDLKVKAMNDEGPVKIPKNVRDAVRERVEARVRQMQPANPNWFVNDDIEDGGNF